MNSQRNIDLNKPSKDAQKLDYEEKVNKNISASQFQSKKDDQG
jgi:hypothetical protein